MDQERINQFNQQKAQQAKEQAILDAIKSAEKAISNTIESTDYQTKTVTVTNDLATPTDIASVVSAINQIKIEATDISPVVSALNQVSEAIAKLPTEYPEIELPDAPEPVESVTVTNLDSLKKYFTQVVEAVSNLKTDIKFDPKIEVKPADVIVNEKEVDLSAITKGLKSVESAVKSIKTPTFDNTDILQGLDSLGQTINNLSFPVPNYVLPFRDEDGIATQAQLTEGVLITGDKALATRLDDTSTPTTTYIGKATVGSANSSAVWQIAKLDTSSGLIKTWAGNANFNQIWNDRVGLTYN